MDDSTYRRYQLLLEQIRDELCGRNAAELARQLGNKNASYVNRLFYPRGKAGAKGIGSAVIVATKGAFALPDGYWDSPPHTFQLARTGRSTPAATAALNVRSAGAGDLVRTAIRTAGHATAADLQRACGMSPAELDAAVAPLLREGALLAAAGDQPGFVVPRALALISATGVVPVMRVDEFGGVHEFASLIPTTGGRYWIEERAGANELHDGLPWFLSDMRPQGFLGRGFAKAHPELALNSRPEDWTDDEILRTLALAGEDLPGNLIVGATSFDRFQRTPSEARRPRADYPDMAQAALQGTAPGSSAGGDQPKFCCVNAAGASVIVKFSPPQSSGTLAQRWSDLLVCEHLALEHLGPGGVPAASTSISQSGGRTFLEVVRFDRTATGRVGMVSLSAYDSQYVGQMDNWAASAERMSRRNLMRPEDADRLRLQEAYGRLIANSDRHYGNVSLVIDAGGDWALSPAYDQLPMHYAPVANELVDRPFDPAAVKPDTHTAGVWAAAQKMAYGFWCAAAADERISPEFRTVAEQHADSLERTIATTRHR